MTMSLRSEREAMIAAGPGPVERSWWARLYRRVMDRWPDPVVRERLAKLEVRRDGR